MKHKISKAVRPHDHAGKKLEAPCRALATQCDVVPRSHGHAYAAAHSSMRRGGKWRRGFRRQAHVRRKIVLLWFLFTKQT